MVEHRQGACGWCGMADAHCGRFGGVPCCKLCNHPAVTTWEPGIERPDPTLATEGRLLGAQRLLRPQPVHVPWFARLRTRIFGRSKSVDNGGSRHLASGWQEGREDAADTIKGER